MSLLEESEFETLRLVWVSGTDPAMAMELGKMLGARARVVHGGREPLANEAPCGIIHYPKGEDVASEVRRLRALVPGVPILVLGLRVEPQLAQTALLVGADGFIHLGMQPAQIIRALLTASEGETLLPRDLLEAFLEEMSARADLTVLTPHQREFLELVAASASYNDEIVVPRELLEAFLREAPMA